MDPAAAPLLSGQVLSLSGLFALLAALPEIDLASEALPTSDLFGNRTLTWTVPAFQPLDPNAGCPPTQQEFNSGLIGCAVAMIDLTSFKPVAAGSGVFEYSGFPFLPPNPTLALSTTTAVPGQTVSVSTPPGATTFWWLPTLAALQAALGGGASSPATVSVSLVDPKGNSVPLPSTISVTPATYNGSTFSPPTISGGFSVPSSVTGPETVDVQVGGELEGLPLSISASAPLFVNNPPTTSIIVPARRGTAVGFLHRGCAHRLERDQRPIPRFRWRVLGSGDRHRDADALRVDLCLEHQRPFPTPRIFSSPKHSMPAAAPSAPPRTSRSRI